MDTKLNKNVCSWPLLFLTYAAGNRQSCKSFLYHPEMLAGKKHVFHFLQPLYCHEAFSLPVVLISLCSPVSQSKPGNCKLKCYIQEKWLWRSDQPLSESLQRRRLCYMALEISFYKIIANRIGIWGIALQTQRIQDCSYSCETHFRRKSYPNQDNYYRQSVEWLGNQEGVLWLANIDCHSSRGWLAPWYSWCYADDPIIRSV